MFDKFPILIDDSDDSIVGLCVDLLEHNSHDDESLSLREVAVRVFLFLLLVSEGISLLNLEVTCFQHLHVFSTARFYDGVFGFFVELGSQFSQNLLSERHIFAHRLEDVSVH